MGKNNLIFGIHPLIEALEAGREIDKILLKRGLRSSEVSHIRESVQEDNEGRASFFVEHRDELTDVRNFGAIARTAECAGVDAIIIPERGSVSVTADAVKTSAGALHRIPVCRVSSIQAAVTLLQENGIQIVAASEKAADIYTESELSLPLGLVLGAEDHGVSQDVLRRADKIVRIPQVGAIGSLNVSVAGGILIYEVVRQAGLGVE